MDPTPTSSAIGAPAMRTAGLDPFQLLLFADFGVGREPGLHAPAGRGVYATSLLRGATDDLVVAGTGLRRGAQAGAPLTAFDGLDGYLSQTAFESQPIRESLFYESCPISKGRNYRT